MPDAVPPPKGPVAYDPDVHLAQGVERLARLVEVRIAPALERIAAAVERLESLGGGGGTGGPASDPRREAVAAIHEALRGHDWARVSGLVDVLHVEHADHPETAAVADLVARRRLEAEGSLREQLTASRGANDAEGVLALRDELAALLDHARRQELDQDLVRWFLRIIQRRMRTGTVAADVAKLAAEAAGRFGATLEGASLRASLPTLRRSAGLCPRCGEPYDGVEDACPRCLPGAAGPVAAPVAAPAPAPAPAASPSGPPPPPSP
jgi:hypothetical protein